MSIEPLRAGRPSVLLVTALVGASLFVGPSRSVSAVEYRLQVVSVYAESFATFLKKGEYADGASGAGLERLEADLDRGRFPAGALLYDRGVEAAGLSTARAYRAVTVPVRIVRGGAGVWDEVRWEGKPGERSVWVVAPTTPRHQELYRTALKGNGPLRQFQPYALRANSVRLAVIALPLNFLWSLEGSDVLWDKYLARSLDLQSEIAAVVGENHNPLFGDEVFFVVRQAEAPTAYKAVLVWRRRPGVDRGNLEGPGHDTPR